MPGSLRPHIVYSDGWKYRLESAYYVETGIRPEKAIRTRYITLLTTGQMKIAEGYCWDGPSGPTIDSPCFMRGSLAHDALYQLMREGYLPAHYRDAADRLLQRICIEDGMTRLRAWWVYQGVSRFAAPASHADHIKPVRTAPQRAA